MRRIDGKVTVQPQFAAVFVVPNIQRYELNTHLESILLTYIWKLTIESAYHNILAIRHHTVEGVFVRVELFVLCIIRSVCHENILKITSIYSGDGDKIVLQSIANIEQPVCISMFSLEDSRRSYSNSSPAMTLIMQGIQYGMNSGLYAGRFSQMGPMALTKRERPSSSFRPENLPYCATVAGPTRSVILKHRSSWERLTEQNQVPNLSTKLVK